MKRFKFSHPALEYVEGHEDADWADTNALWVAGKMIVCPCCGGEGHHVRRDIDDSRLVDSMREDGDYEGIEAYFGGAYDVTCEECNGRNVILDVDWDSVPEWAQKAVEDWNRCEREMRAEQEAERRMGA